MTEDRPESERIESLLDRLERDYGAVRVIEKTWGVSPEAHERTRERIEAGTDGGAGVWLTNDDGEVLLVRNEGDEGWGDPGGKVEGDECFETAAKRETREEAGVEARITDCLEIHLVTMHHEDDPDRAPLVTPIVVFEGDHVGGEPRARDGEIAAVGWFSAPPETVLYEEVATRRYPASG